MTAGNGRPLIGEIYQYLKLLAMLLYLLLLFFKDRIVRMLASDLAIFLRATKSDLAISEDWLIVAVLLLGTYFKRIILYQLNS